MPFFDFNIILRVFTTPNAAFLYIRENEEKYFAQSIALLIISSIIGGFAILPFVVMPLDEAYFEIEGMDDVEETFIMEESAIVMSFLSSILTGLVSVALYYFIGKRLDGNTNWKKVFAVVLHVHAIVIPITIIITIVLFVMWDALTSIEPSILLAPGISENEALSLLDDFIGLAVLVAVLGIGFAIWIFILTIKAIKIVHGFGTGKAFGLVVLVAIIVSLISIPFSFA